MDFSNTRFSVRRTAAFLVTIVSALFLCACSGGKQANVVSSLGEYRMENSQCFYDLTEAAAEAVQGEKLRGCALRDEGNLLLLSENGGGTCTARLLSLRTGKTSVLCTYENTTRSSAAPSILSVDPLILYDKESRIIYSPEPGQKQEPVVLPETLSEAEPVIAYGKVYLSTPKGILYKTEQDGTLTEYWRLPSQCSWMSPTSQQDGETLVFSTFAENTPEQPIYAQLDPKSMETSFFTSSKDDIFYAALSDGRYCALLFDKDPLLRVWDPGENSAFSFPLPQELTQLVTNTSFYGEDSSLVPLACTNPAAGSLFAFTLSDHEGNPARICLCDITGRNASEISEWHTPARGIHSFPSKSYGDLSEKAQELQDKYGVVVVLGSNVPSAFPDYTVEYEESETVIRSGLQLLEEALALYPEGYFRSLCDLHYRDIVFYLTGEMTPRFPETSVADAGAFTTDQHGVARIALNLDGGLYRGMILHEITHATDYALIGEGLLSEEAWAKFNPPGFTYYESYLDGNGNSYEAVGDPQYTASYEEDPQNIYFYDTYSKTFALEDRARLMEVFLRDADAWPETVDSLEADPAFESGHLKAKINWYLSLLRKF